MVLRDWLGAQAEQHRAAELEHASNCYAARDLRSWFATFLEHARMLLKICLSINREVVTSASPVIHSKSTGWRVRSYERESNSPALASTWPNPDPKSVRPNHYPYPLLGTPNSFVSVRVRRNIHIRIIHAFFYCPTSVHAPSGTMIDMR
jgi:hypothetical protein